MMILILYSDIKENIKLIYMLEILIQMNTMDALQIMNLNVKKNGEMKFLHFPLKYIIHQINLLKSNMKNLNVNVILKIMCLKLKIDKK